MTPPRLHIALACLALLGGTTFAEVITVAQDGSGDYTTIQEAIGAASDGDEIVVSQGNYTGTGSNVVNMLGRKVLLRSSDGSDVTIIDGENERRGVLCASNEPIGTAISGFTITRCVANWIDDDGDGEIGAWELPGAGVRCSPGAAVSLIDCVLTDNHSDPYGGGGAATVHGIMSLTGCEISDNSAGYGGGAIAILEGELNAEDCTFTGSSGACYGGAIHIVGSSSAAVSFTNCEFSANEGCFGGAILIEHNATPVLTNCRFEGNSSSHAGGALDVRASLSAIDCTFEANQAGWGSSGYSGGAVAISSDGTSTFSGCTFAYNFSDEPGGAIAIAEEGSATIHDSHFCSNSPDHINGSWEDGGDNDFHPLCLDDECLETLPFTGEGTGAYMDVDVDGEWAVIALHEPWGMKIGSVYLFHRNLTGSGWVQYAQLYDDVPISSVALDGELLAVGRGFDNQVDVWRRIGGSWGPGPAWILTPGLGGPWYVYSFDVDLEGTSLAVASKRSFAPGAVHVYGLKGGTWTLENLFEPIDPPSDGFPGSVDLDGVRVVGTDSDNNTAYVFWRSPFTETSIVIPDDAQPGDHAGRTIECVNGTLVMGSMFHDLPDGNHGLAWVFQWDGSSWVEQAQWSRPDASDTYLWPTDVAIGSEVIALVGSSTVAGGYRSLLETWSLTDNAHLDTQLLGLPNEHAECISEVAADNGRLLIGFGTPVDWLEGPHQFFWIDPYCDCPGDATGDYVIDVNDVLYLLSAWGTDDPNADFDDNGLVNVDDILILLSHFGDSCP